MPDLGDSPTNRLLAPRESGEKLVHPPWRLLPEILLRNREYRRVFDRPWFGMTLADLASDARREFAVRAADYVNQNLQADRAPGDSAFKRLDAATFDVDAPLILTGHQPGIWHPGVWIKNFAVDALARAVGGWGVHLCVDGDLCRVPAIRVPTGTLDNPTGESIAFDATAPPTPWEDRELLDEGIWRRFGQRTTDALAPLIENPLIRTWPPGPSTTGKRTNTGDNQFLLRDALARWRYELEQTWGNRILEIPQSQMCQMRAFRLFACDILGAAPRFRLAYNAALDNFRRTFKVRNHAHPFPNLASEADWVETPFWIWSRTEPQRRPLWAKRTGTSIQLSNRSENSLRGVSLEFSLPLKGEPFEALERLAEWESIGVRIRSRALLTTLFVRWLLADLFIHGIGGAHYDRVTDRVSEAFYGAAPPSHATLTGTLCLPLSLPPLVDVRRVLGGRLRDLTYHPEKSVDVAQLSPNELDAFKRLLEEKQRWISLSPTPATSAHRHRRIADANQGLRPFVESARLLAEAEWTQAGAQRRAAEILASREFAFCLFPEKNLRSFVLDFY